jgi:anti-sigma-K factor RskA
MATRRHIPGEDELLREARAVLPPLPEREPRAGFAAMVALNARDRRRPFASWLRWSFGGLAVAGAAAVALAVAMPPAHREDDVVLAQRLELFEDLSVVQNQQALEDLDVVEVLHTLQPEARP